jgi:hypothetical protein
MADQDKLTAIFKRELAKMQDVDTLRSREASIASIRAMKAAFTPSAQAETLRSIAVHEDASRRMREASTLPPEVIKERIEAQERQHTQALLSHVEKLRPELKQALIEWAKKGNHKKVKPGPKELTPEEKIELVNAFRGSGYSQPEFLKTIKGRKFYISVSTLKRAIDWYRKKFEK